MRALFIGLSSHAVCWYRCALPAMALGHDWVGLAGEPPHLRYDTGLVGGDTKLPAFDSYDVVVMQQPRGMGWFKVIKGLQERGVKVLFEVDDYLHAIRKQADHDFSLGFGKEALAGLERNMRICDGIVCSTPYIARRYRAFNKNVWVCRNGIDMGRYRLTRPERETVNIGWAGATGHLRAVQPWLDAMGMVMHHHPETTFISIGMPFADAFRRAFPDRCLAIPWAMVEVYPGAMTMMDIAIAPAGQSGFFKGKSDLRWVEAGALGIPIVADPEVYPNIENGVTGFHARTPAEAGMLVTQLVEHPELRTRVGAAAKQHVLEHRDVRVTSRDWAGVFDEITA